MAVITLKLPSAQARALAEVVKRLGQQAGRPEDEPGAAEALRLLQTALEIAGFLPD